MVTPTQLSHWFKALFPLALGCHCDGAQSSKQLGTAQLAIQAAVDLRPPLLMPYPRATWRFAARSELEGVVLWVSQILIRHQDARISGVSFDFTHWASVPPPPTRNRERALAL